MSTCIVPAWAGPVVQLTFEGLTAPVYEVREPVLVSDFYDITPAGALGSSKAVFYTPGSPVRYAPRDLNIRSTADSVWAQHSVADVGGDAVPGTGRYPVTRTDGTGSALGLGLGALLFFEGPHANATGQIVFDFVDGASFDGALSFYYSADRPLLSVKVIGKDQAGDVSYLSGSISTSSGVQACPSDIRFCVWDKFQLYLTGLVEVTQVVFQGSGVMVDNVTFGSAIPDTIPTIPEPATYALMAFGLAAAAMTALRRSRRA